MGFRFRKSIKILPGIRLNLSNGTPSITVGRRGASFTFGSRGIYSNLGLPGTGLSYRTRLDNPVHATKVNVSANHRNQQIPKVAKNMASQTKQFKGSSGQAYDILERLAAGGQGTVYKTKCASDGQFYAVKMYHKHLATPEQKRHIQKLIDHGQPQCNNNDIEFIWPIELVEFPGIDSFGYSMKLYDGKHYCHYNKVINGRQKEPTLDKLCRLSQLVCFAMDAIHRSGLAYCDVNLGNIQFDIENGRIIVCDNDNVTINNEDTNVIGVPEFMAPEIAKAESQPNASSDLYSIAIMLYQMWTWEHPMEGQLTAKVRCWDQPAKRKHYADSPLFCHHPTDRSNAADNDPTLSLSVKRWNKLCPEHLRSHFVTTFTEGVEKPGARVRLSKWQQIFMELADNVVTCKHCKAINIFDTKKPNQVCFKCANKLSVAAVLTIKYQGGSAQLIVREGATLRQHHTSTDLTNADKVLGLVEIHPKNPSAFIFRNQTNDTWFYEYADKTHKLEPGQARALLPNMTLSVGNVTLTMELTN